MIVEHPGTPSMTRNAPRPQIRRRAASRREEPARPRTNSSIRAHHGEHIRRHGRRGWIEHSVNGDADTASVSPPTRTTRSPFAAGPSTGGKVPPIAVPPPRPIGRVEREDLLAAGKLVMPVPANSLVGIPSDGPLTVTGLLVDPDNRVWRVVHVPLQLDAGAANGTASLGRGGGGYVEPRFLDSSDAAGLD